MGSNGNATTVTTTNSFSIRSYVLGAREQDIGNNWPFHEKCLQFCLKHGINKLLPPFQSLDSMRSSSYRDHIHSSCAQEQNAHIGSNNYICVEVNREKELVKVENNLCIDEAISEITKQMSPFSLSTDKHKHDDSDLSSDNALQPMDMKVHNSAFMSNLDCQTGQCLSAVPSNKGSSKKGKKRKGKHKKRSMAEIYAEASPCTLEDLAKINGSTSAAVPRVRPFVYDQNATENTKIVDEINESMTTVDDDYRHNPAESLKMKHSRDGNKAKVVYPGGKKQILKIKFSGCKSKAHNRKTIS